MSVFPLPLSNNFKLFNYRFPSGPFVDYKVLWPAQFVKDDSIIGAEHVFILKNSINEFMHCIWRWDSREPELLQKKFWKSCFKEELHTSVSNRYLFTAHSLNLLLPYVPHTLHRKWQKSKTNQRDDAFVVSTFSGYFDLGVFDQTKKRFERFPGWQKKVLKNPLNEYVTYLATKQNQEVPINFGIQLKDLKPEAKKKLDEACAIIHAVFPNFCLEVPTLQM